MTSIRARAAGWVRVRTAAVAAVTLALGTLLLLTAIGSANAQAPPTPGDETQPTVLRQPIAQGWTLASWLGPTTTVAEALGEILDEIDALFQWDASADAYHAFHPGFPPDLNEVAILTYGDAFWLFSAAGGVIWETLVTDGDLPAIEPGLNLLAWTAPVRTAAAEALRGFTGADARLLWTWEASAQTFLTFDPTALAVINSLGALTFGQAVWVQGAALPAAGTLPAAASVADAQRAIAFIDTPEGSGTGFVVTRTQLLTNAHVVGDFPTVEVRIGGASLTGTVTAINPLLDAAVVTVDAFPAGVRRLDWESAARPRSGVDVWAWGFPLGAFAGQDTEPTLTNGIVSASQLIEGIRYVQTNTEINPGNSGGPLVLTDGRVVGINTFKFADVGLEGLNFAISVADHRADLAELLTGLSVERPPLPETFGDDPDLDAQWIACGEGGMAACDDLFLAAPVGSDYGRWADTCDARQPELTGLFCTTVFGEVASDGFGDDTALDALWIPCENGDMQTCDDLFAASPPDSAYRRFGDSCGARQPELTGRLCVDVFGGG